MELKKKGNKRSVMGEAVSRGNKMEVQLFIKVSIAAYSVHGIVNKRTFTLNLFVLQHAYYNARANEIFLDNLAKSRSIFPRVVAFAFVDF